MKIGIVYGAFRPYHSGHHALIEKAAAECGKVMLFASLSDRRRPGEVQILGADMQKIWLELIQPIIPSNVVLNFGGSPVSNVYTFIGDERDAGSADRYVIYSDPDDLDKSFPRRSLEKYFGEFFHTGHVVIEPVQRTETVNVSGTKMRNWLRTGDKQAFVDHVPEAVNGNAVWDILKPNAKLVERKVTKGRSNLKS